MNTAILQLALNNFKSRLRRTTLNILLITTATSGLMIVAGFGLFTYYGLEQRSSRETGQLVISQPKYFTEAENRIMDNGLSDFPSMQKKLASISLIEQALPLIQLQGLIAGEQKSAAFLGRGIDPREISVRGPFFDLVAGDALSYTFNPDTDPEVIIGVGLAKNLSAKVGDYVTLLANTVDDSLNGFDAKVVGISKTGIPELDNRTLFTHYQSAQDLLATDKIHQIGIYLKDNSQIEQANEKIKELFPNLKTTHWKDLAVFYQGVKNLYNNIFLFIGSITFVIIFFAVYNLINTSIWERTREIGVLSALGISAKEIMASLFVESTLMSIISIIVAVLMYALTTLSLLFLNFEMAPPPGQTTGYPLQLLFSGEVVIYLSLMTFFIVSLSTYFASSKINKLSITQAISHL